MINKKAQGMSISTIILLILGLIILVVLILGFTIGWAKLAPWIGGNNNLETLKNSCGAACSTGGQYDFCTVKRLVKDGVSDKFEATCNDLATKQQYINKQYGISACPGLCTA
ncbi:MAG: hypothetical protein NTZ83_02825 [Candidatus Pacearchaeota archaeon]|nr:hypothetical protein [Candidatus Pacearchaeota archaeon]